jgi:hypothetical protein
MPTDPVQTIPTDDLRRAPEPSTALCFSGGGYVDPALRKPAGFPYKAARV